MALELEDVTGAIIGAGIEVHRTLGPGLLEAVYEAALVVELDFRRIPFARQIPVTVRDRDHGLLLNFSESALEIKRFIARAGGP